MSEVPGLTRNSLREEGRDYYISQHHIEEPLLYPLLLKFSRLTVRQFMTVIEWTHFYSSGPLAFLIPPTPSLFISIVVLVKIWYKIRYRKSTTFFSSLDPSLVLLSFSFLFVLFTYKYFTKTHNRKTDSDTRCKDDEPTILKSVRYIINVLTSFQRRSGTVRYWVLISGPHVLVGPVPRL